MSFESDYERWDNYERPDDHERVDSSEGAHETHEVREDRYGETPEEEKDIDSSEPLPGESRRKRPVPGKGTRKNK